PGRVRARGAGASRRGRLPPAQELVARGVDAGADRDRGTGDGLRDRPRRAAAQRRPQRQRGADRVGGLVCLLAGLLPTPPAQAAAGDAEDAAADAEIAAETAAPVAAADVAAT